MAGFETSTYGRFSDVHRGGERDRLRAWALERERARGHNKAAVALANKLARIVWAVWKNEHAYAAATEKSND